MNIDTAENATVTVIIEDGTHKITRTFYICQRIVFQELHEPYDIGWTSLSSDTYFNPRVVSQKVKLTFDVTENSEGHTVLQIIEDKERTRQTSYDIEARKKRVEAQTLDQAELQAFREAESEKDLERDYARFYLDQLRTHSYNDPSVYLTLHFLHGDKSRSKLDALQRIVDGYALAKLRDGWSHVVSDYSYDDSWDRDNL